MYPSPWPLIPLSCPTIPLHSFIPHEHLPKKLFVHDPWNLLVVTTATQYWKSDFGIPGADWESKADAVHIFHLNASISGENRGNPSSDPKLDFDSGGTPQVETHLSTMNIMDAGDVKKSFYGTYVKLPFELNLTPSGTVPPPLVIVYDAPPISSWVAPNLQIDDAHLYLSPAQFIGAGHHSVLFHGEWELPREHLVPPPHAPVMCHMCIDVEVEHILRESDWANVGDNSGRRSLQC